MECAGVRIGRLSGDDIPAKWEQARWEWEQAKEGHVHQRVASAAYCQMVPKKGAPSSVRHCTVNVWLCDEVLVIVFRVVCANLEVASRFMRTDAKAREDDPALNGPNAKPACASALALAYLCTSREGV